MSVSNNNADLSPCSKDELEDLGIDQSEFDDAKSGTPSSSASVPILASLITFLSYQH